MTSYQPTRADALKPGDVVTNPYDGVNMVLDAVDIQGATVWLYADGVTLSFANGDLLDKRIAQEARDE